MAEFLDEQGNLIKPGQVRPPPVAAPPSEPAYDPEAEVSVIPKTGRGPQQTGAGKQDYWKDRSGAFPESPPNTPPPSRPGGGGGGGGSFMDAHGNLLTPEQGAAAMTASRGAVPWAPPPGDVSKTVKSVGAGALINPSALLGNIDTGANIIYNWGRRQFGAPPVPRYFGPQGEGTKAVNQMLPARWQLPPRVSLLPSSADWTAWGQAGQPYPLATLQGLATRLAPGTFGTGEQLANTAAYQPQSRATQALQTAGNVATAALEGGALKAGAGALLEGGISGIPRALPAVLPATLKGGVRGAIAGTGAGIGAAGAQQAFMGSPYEVPATLLATALGGAGGQWAGRRLVSPYAYRPPLETEETNANQTLTRHGIDQTPSQSMQHEGLAEKEAESGIGAGVNLRQAQQFTGAALRDYGGVHPGAPKEMLDSLENMISDDYPNGVDPRDLNRASPEVLNAAKRGAGQVINRVSQNNDVNTDREFYNDLIKAGQFFKDNSTDAAKAAPFVARRLQQVRAILRGRGNFIDGSDYQNLRSQLGADISRLGGKGYTTDPQNEVTGRTLQLMQNAMDDAMERTLIANKNTVDLTDLQNAREWYRNLLTIEDAVGRSPTGARNFFRPEQLREAIKSREGKPEYTRGYSKLNNFVRAGEIGLRPLGHAKPPKGIAKPLIATAASLLGGHALGLPAAGEFLGAMSGREALGEMAHALSRRTYRPWVTLGQGPVARLARARQRSRFYRPPVGGFFPSLIPALSTAARPFTPAPPQSYVNQQEQQ